MAPLTLMAVHAHPDDEAISTGGVLARYADEGIRTVLVTCTDGGCGDAPGGLKPGDDGFDRDQVVAARQVELARSCEALGITHFESLDYPDSGMMGWPQNEAPGSFWTTPVEDGAKRLTALLEKYRPQVVVTYNENGFYGHPDHIQAHRITMAAAEATGIPDKLYYTAVPRSRLVELGRRLREMNLELPTGGPETGSPDAGGGLDATNSSATEEITGPDPDFGTPDEQVTTFVDVSSAIDRKFASLQAHDSQSENLFLLRLGPDLFAEAMGSESFVRVVDRTGAPLPEDDLFAGLR